MPFPQTARNLLSLAIGGLLLLPGAPLAAKGKWDCRADADGKGWDCLLDGRPAEPSPPMTTAPEPTDTRPVAADDARVKAKKLPAVAPALATPEPEPSVEPGPAATAAAGVAQPVEPEPEPSRPAPVEPASPIAEDATPYERLATAGGRIDEGLNWERCGPPPRSEAEQAAQRQRVDRESAPIQINADSADASDAEQRALFQGNVQLQRADQQVEADQVHYDRTTQQLDAQGNVYYAEQGLRFTGSSAHLELDTDRGNMQDVEYRLTDRNSRGTATAVEILDQDVTRFDQITYTTCRPGNDDWVIQAEELTTDQAEGRGEARHATLRFRGVPVAYTPYVSFPIDDRRKSGFLTPAFGVGDETGVDISTPYYWNIAPNMDATITPRVMTDRGVMLGGEYRYLTENHEGEVRGTYLPDDDEFEDDRSAFSYQHKGRLTPRLTTDVDVNVVSDDDYLSDLGNSLSITSTRHLVRRGDLRYRGGDWSALARLRDYQTVDKTVAAVDEPYSQLPQLLLDLNKPDQAYGLTYHLRNEYVYFDHDDKVKGHRLDLHPALSLPMHTAYGFLTPKVGARYTTYSLQDEAPGESDSPSRFLPIVSVDSGLFFERDTSWDDRPLVQTLEPRAYYLLIPAENQNDIPIFDSDDFDFSFASLFRENRFSGADRLGDAHQLTLALTSRALDQVRGSELLRGSIGTILHFRDRSVTLPGEPEQTESTSSLVGEVAARLSDAWSTRAGLQWDPHGGGTERGVAQLHYQPDEHRITNLAYRYREDILEQTDLSARWPLGRRTHLVGRWAYSLRDSQTVEAFGGIEYDSCCWVLRLVGRHYINDVDADANNAIMVQLELKGLTSLGDPIDEFLERGILGYQVEEY